MQTRRQIEMRDSWDDPLAPDESSGKTEKPKFEARLAIEMVKLFIPLILPRCEVGVDELGEPMALLKVCGSLRRRKPMVGDAEIVFVPRTDCVTAAVTDLLGEVIAPAVHAPATHAVLDDLVRRGVLTKRMKSNGALTGWGPWNRFATHVESGVPVDFFGCTAASFWNTVVCRTGGMRSNVRICEAAHAVGWNWEPSPEQPGFWRRAGLGIERHAVKSEREVFEFVKLPYLEPWERE